VLTDGSIRNRFTGAQVYGEFYRPSLGQCLGGSNSPNHT
jgi:hypothetical protein